MQEMATLSKPLPAGLVDAPAGGADAKADHRRMYEMLQRMQNGQEEDDDEGDDDGGAYGFEEEQLDSDDEDDGSGM